MTLRLFFALTILFVAAPAQADMLDYPTVVLRTLDKSTARTNTVEVKIGQTIEFGSLFIKAQSCRKSEPLDKPESASFLQIWEVPVNSDKSKWVFSGWMFASSPALSAMDHPIYDVWVLDCKGREADAPAENRVTIEGEEVPLIDEEITESVENTPAEANKENQNKDGGTAPVLDSILEKLKTDPQEPISQNYE